MMLIASSVLVAVFINYLIETYDKKGKFEKFLEKLVPPNPHNRNH